MTHLRIEQNGLDVGLPNAIVSILYNAAKGQLDSSSNLKGSITVEHCHQALKLYLETLFPLFSILCTGDYYIDFKDPLVEQILLLNNIGDGTGVTYSNALSFSDLRVPSIFYNSSITNFDEFSLFGVTLLTWNSLLNRNKNFEGCSSLTSIDLNNIIRPNDCFFAFAGCTSLTTVKNFKLDTVVRYMFNNCSSLRSIDLSNVTILGAGCFEGCTSLDVVANHLDFTKLISGNYYNDCDTAFVGVLNVGDVLLPNFTGSVHHMFRDCTSITSLSNCPKITDIGTYNNAWKGSFSGCSALDKLDFSSSTNITKLRRLAIDTCNVLRIIKLPSTLTTVVGMSIRNCPNLKALVINAAVPPSFILENYSGLFNWSDIKSSDLKIYVPDASVNDYKQASTWSEKADYIFGLSLFAIDFPND